MKRPHALDPDARLRRRTLLGGLASAVGCASMPCPIGASPNRAGSRRAVASDVALRFVSRHRPEQLPWRWDGAIAVLGLARLASAPHDPFASFVRRYFQHHRGSARITMPDHCPPALAAVAAAPWLADAELHVAIAPVAHFLRTQPRNPLGALDHLGVHTMASSFYASSIWIDSLMMVGATAVAVGGALKCRTLVDFGLRQPQIFADVLQDRRTGLFRHAYLHERGVSRPRGPTFWLRGNGWVAVALAEMLDCEHPSANENRRIFCLLAHALIAAQGPDGLWRTVLGDDRTYREPSGSALVAYALAKGARSGVLPSAGRVAAERAFAGLSGRLRQTFDGASLPGISGPTIPGSRLAYASVPRRADLDYGVGALCMLADELEESTL